MSKTKDGKPMSLSHLKKVYKEFNELSVEERMTNYNLREDRADVLVHATGVFNNVMSWSDINKILFQKFP